MPKLKVDGVPRAIPRYGAALLAGLALVSGAGQALARNAQAQRDEPATTGDRLILLNFARCVAERMPERARALLAADYRTGAYQASMRRLAVGRSHCLPGGSGRLRFSGVLFAGNLAEAFLAGTRSHGALAERVALNPAAAPLPARDQSEVMALCVVRAAPDDTETLLGTGHGSAEEAAALRALAPRIGSCLASGVEMRLNRPGLRALLALAAWRLVRHNAAPAAVAARN
jgi:hypothetical protein